MYDRLFLPKESEGVVGRLTVSLSTLQVSLMCRAARLALISFRITSFVCPHKYFEVLSPLTVSTRV